MKAAKGKVSGEQQKVQCGKISESSPGKLGGYDFDTPHQLLLASCSSIYFAVYFFHVLMSEVSLHSPV